MNQTTKARVMFGGLGILCVFFCGAWLDRAMADRAPSAPPLTYSGTALMGGTPISDGMHNIGLTLHTHPSGVVGAVCSQGPSATPTSAGRFSITLADAACGNAIQQGSELYAEVTVDGTTLPRTRIGAVPYAVQAENGVPPGTVMAFAGETVPLGWIVCDGRALSGGDPQYAALRSAIGTTWGTGTTDADPATDFNIPDLRGRFLRGFDDATTARDEDRATRVQSAPGGRTGAHVGTLEGDAFGAHAHGYGGTMIVAEDLGTAVFGFTLGGTPFQTHGTSTQASGGSETRPENAAVLYIIKL